jgi:hypothetical protein
LGTGIPRSGGLKNYLERAYSPRLAATCVYAFCEFCRQVVADYRLRLSPSIRFECHHFLLICAPSCRGGEHDLEASGGRDSGHDVCNLCKPASHFKDQTEIAALRRLSENRNVRKQRHWIRQDLYAPLCDLHR